MDTAVVPPAIRAGVPRRCLHGRKLGSSPATSSWTDHIFTRFRVYDGMYVPWRPSTTSRRWLPATAIGSATVGSRFRPRRTPRERSSHHRFDSTSTIGLVQQLRSPPASPFANADLPGRRDPSRRPPPLAAKRSACDGKGPTRGAVATLAGSWVQDSVYLSDRRKR